MEIRLVDSMFRNVVVGEIIKSKNLFSLNLKSFVADVKPISFIQTLDGFRLLFDYQGVRYYLDNDIICDNASYVLCELDWTVDFIKQNTKFGGRKHVS